MPAATETHRHNAERWLRQLLFYRYSVLLAQLKSQFPLTPEQEEVLMRRILSIEWVDGAIQHSK
jgi:hypothetical protein